MSKIEHFMNPENSPLFLGIDIGSISLNCVITKENGIIVSEYYERSAGKPVEKLVEVLKYIKQEFGEITFSGCVVCGSGKELVADIKGVETVNEIVAHARAAWKAYPSIQTVFEIGGQDSKYISIGRHKSGNHFLKDHKFNQLCAAGTGAFLDQQAERLGCTAEELGVLAAQSEKSANVAGRCAVFAKTDMIHLQQKAVPVEEIASGLCFALARNYLSTMCNGRVPNTPILFQGGVAANKAVVRAFRELLNIEEEELVVPGEHKVMGAWGCARIAEERQIGKQISTITLASQLEKIQVEEQNTSLPAIERGTINQGGNHTDSPLSNHFSLKGPFFLGVDIGSVSTKCAIINSHGELLASAYGKTAGKPIESLSRKITELKSKLPEELTIANVVATGSGRHVAAALLGCSETLDEISAQMISCRHFFPQADAIIEIGGQDSKFIRIKEGQLISFTMNKACAAGTGAFLEEQSGRLRISIENEFAEKAFGSHAPVTLGSKCTVFMDSDLVHHLQRGASTEDLCAGLAYSVVENYLEKVVGKKNYGDRIIFQGGVARNKAIHSVFQQCMGKAVALHPHPEVSGAMGAALAAMERDRNSEKENKLSLSDIEVKADIQSFSCQGCENLCEIRTVLAPGREPAYFGGICGKFEMKSPTGHRQKSANEQEPDPFQIREQLLWDAVVPPAQPATRKRITIPIALTIYDHLPFWGTFFNSLGYDVSYGGDTNRGVVEKGILYGPSGFCYPMKILFGHVWDLIEQGAKTLFIPHLKLFAAVNGTGSWYGCPYTQTAPSIARASIADDTEILSLEYPIESELQHWIKMTGERLAIEKDAIWDAVKVAQAAQKRFVDGCHDAGKKIIQQLQQKNRRGAVLLGRPYNTSDRFSNLHLARKLQSLDIVPIPYDFIPPSTEPLPQLWNRIRWGYGRSLVQSARALKQFPFLGAVVVTNFGCGPDGFVDQYLDFELSDIPHIVLEFDEHQGEAGLLTRLEAFARVFTPRTEKVAVVNGRDPGKPRIPLRDYTYYIPSFMDHAYALTGALQGSGCRTVLLPPTDDESMRLGEQYCNGKECHPFVSFTGDLLKAALQPGFVAEKACYYGPSYFGPCLLPQYCLALHLILEKAGLADVTVMNIADETNMSELGPLYMVRLVLGMYAIDRFFRWKTEIEPYERKSGEISRTYSSVLLMLEQGLASGSFMKFFKAIRKGVQLLDKVPLHSEKRNRPAIGVVGDIYTRVNTYSNNRLFERLQDHGFEVWASSSMIDVSFLSIEQRHAKYEHQGKVMKSLLARLGLPGSKFIKWLVDRNFPDSLRGPEDGDYHTVAQNTDKYTDFWIDKALSLNINRVEELNQANAAGVVNVMCHNCMLGTITDALSPSMVQEMDDFPITTLVYEGLQSTHNSNRIEAFVQQLKSKEDMR